ncbi:MAG: heat-inducible transcription repressor HrcA [Aeriscardovia sp.]|nr:heat-inducible transcription repressor HrcA [Aeriscardovia sp.]MBQ1424684.1 heat-inducible transcription repressor HrcA [Aeriscardovia sp.]MBQ5556767.1 heat-inducible transcription repressor HrcA [Aeriscardovia sp.]MBQ5762662.1 heat-inducible transcription repressor HrcA [Aeriscardovia sp.]
MHQDRQALVLKIVVEKYIRTHEPVASGSVVREFPVPISSATIRNDMAALEREGYLVEPHPSAGRVPTDKAYRSFVDSLAPSCAPPSQSSALKSILSASSGLEEGIEEAVKFLAGATGQVAVGVAPPISSLSLHRLEVVGKDQLTVILISDNGQVEKTGMENPGLSKEEIGEEVEKINRELSGAPISSLGRKIASIAPSGPKEEKFLQALSESMEFGACAKREVYVYGVNLAYREIGKDFLAPLLDALEEEISLIRIMASISREGVGVAIGSEIQSDSLSHLSVISARYGTECWEALIGSIGNTYMDYPCAISSLRGVAECLSDFASQQFPSNRIDGSFNGE